MRERGSEGEVIRWGFDPNQLLAPYRQWGFTLIRHDNCKYFSHITKYPRRSVALLRLFLFNTIFAYPPHHPEI